jgi:hypothetical protein
MREYGEDRHPVSHGFAAVFQMRDGGFELLQLNDHHEKIIEELLASKQ